MTYRTMRVVNPGQGIGMKMCPGCQSITPINEMVCPYCGHRFRTYFKPAQGPDRTVAFNQWGIQLQGSPIPPPVLPPKRRAIDNPWVVVGIAAGILAILLILSMIIGAIGRNRGIADAQGFLGVYTFDNGRLAVILRNTNPEAVESVTIQAATDSQQAFSGHWVASDTPDGAAFDTSWKVLDRWDHGQTMGAEFPEFPQLESPAFFVIRDGSGNSHTVRLPYKDLTQTGN